MDILIYLGDDVNHKPSEKELLFGNRYKYDYLNSDALMTRVDVKDGRIVFPDGMNYRVLWIPRFCRIDGRNDKIFEKSVKFTSFINEKRLPFLFSIF